MVLALFVSISTAATTAVTAHAADYIVDSTGDQVDEIPGADGCKTAASACTLRAAIEESNASTGVLDTITFSASFDGEGGDTIELATPLPPITDRVKIHGGHHPGQCTTDYADVPGPCVGIDGPVSGTAFQVEAERVVIEGLAITGALTAIKVIGGPGLESWNSWIGVKLDGGAGANGTGIFIDPRSNGPLIGGYYSDARNIFANNADAALVIEGADNAVVRGNGFGISPLGSGHAPNGKDIVITDSTEGGGFAAENNWIGETVHGGPLVTPVCDGGCNVISGAGTSGIDLSGDGTGDPPATGPTWIHGNYIGLSAFGTTAVPNADQGVFVGEADDVKIGGSEGGDANSINGGSYGVVSEPGAEGLIIEGNQIGLDPTGNATLAPPSSVGLAINSEEAPANFAEINRNRISMENGAAIQLKGGGAVVEFNLVGRGVDGGELPGGSIGIRTLGVGLLGNLLFGNTINNASSFGVLIENDHNGVYGNQIENAQAGGIRIQASPGVDPTGNWIGDPTAFRENTISSSGGNAIEIVASPESENIVDRNVGTGNAGLFVDLGDDGSGNGPAGPNGGVQSPQITDLTTSSVSGLARPGAEVIVFAKATPSLGEIAGYRGRTHADFDGSWILNFKASLSPGSSVGVIQNYGTVKNNKPVRGTSEMAIATLPASGVEAQGGPALSSECRLGGGGYCGLSLPPLRTLIHRSRIRAGIAEFVFSSSGAGASFECRIDDLSAKRCKSPRTYRHLTPGRHVFRVWAINSSDRDMSPATRRFRIRK